MIGNWPGPDPIWLLLPLVFDLAEESRTEESVGLLYVGEIRGEQRSLDLESSIFIDGSHLSARADNEEFVAITHDLKAVAGVWLVCPLDLQPLTNAALNRTMETNRKFANFIKGLHGW